MSVDTTTLGPNSLVRNTVTNRNTIAPVLFSICTNNNAPITLVGDDEHDLNSTDVYQAICIPGGQAVNLQSCTGASTISVGEDSAINALRWLTHLNLLGGVGRKVNMQFYVSGGTADVAASVNLANTSGTSLNVQIQTEGGSASDSEQLLWGGACAGTVVNVEVSCVDNTAGSEKVAFNILYGYWC